MDYVLIILLSPDKQKVLMQKKDRSIFAGKYNYPGGKIRPCESPADAASREMLEETGVQLNNLKNYQYIGKIMTNDCIHYTPDKKSILYFYAGLVDENLPKQQPGETEPLSWFPISEIKTLHETHMLAGYYNTGELTDIEQFMQIALKKLNN